MHDLKTIFFLLLCGHAVGDFAMQNEWVARNKDRNARKAYSTEDQAKMSLIWPYLLSAHSFHHGLIVFLITQKLSLGIAETIVHWISDYAKCEGLYGFHADQAIHIISKIVWVTLISYELI